MDHSKVEVIQDWLKPRKVKDIQSFLGFTNFYMWFIHDYSRLTVLLTWLTQKGTAWVYSDSCWSLFEALKRAFTTALVLTQWEPGNPLIIESNASDYTLSAILSTITPSDNQVHPVAFHSWMFNSAELNDNVHDKELLAIFEEFKCWRHYLKGSPTLVDIITDHKNLEYFSTMKLLTQCQLHWSKFLSQFNLVIRFHPKKLRTKLDSLTRWWDIYLKEGERDYASVNPHNLHLVFTNKQLASSLYATSLYTLVLWASVIMDVQSLHSDIRSIHLHPPRQSHPLLVYGPRGVTPSW